MASSSGGLWFVDGMRRLGGGTGAGGLGVGGLGSGLVDLELVGLLVTVARVDGSFVDTSDYKDIQM